MSAKTFPWLKLQRAALHNPKIVTLTDRQHRAWINCMLVADHETGCLPSMRDLAVHLRMSLSDVEAIVVDLVEAELIDAAVDATGRRRYTMHDWSTHQAKSADSSERVKRHREKAKSKRNADVTLRETDVTLLDRDREEEEDKNITTCPQQNQIAAREAPAVQAGSGSGSGSVAGKLFDFNVERQLAELTQRAKAFGISQTDIDDATRAARKAHVKNPASHCASVLTRKLNARLRADTISEFDGAACRSLLAGDKAQMALLDAAYASRRMVRRVTP